MQYLSASFVGIAVLASIVAAEPAAETRELGKKKHGGHGGYAAQPIIIAAPQKKGSFMPQPMGKKGGYGGYGGGYGGLGYGRGGYGRWMAEEDEVEALSVDDDTADARELGKKHGGHGGYAARPIIIATPQKKGNFMPVPMGKKGGYGGYGGYGGNGYGRWMAEEEIEASDVSEGADERALHQVSHNSKMAPRKVVRPVTKKQTYTPVKKAVRPVQKKAPMPVQKKAPRPVQKKTIRTVTKKAAPVKKQPVQQYKKAARPVYYQRYHGNKGF